MILCNSWEGACGFCWTPRFQPRSRAKIRARKKRARTGELYVDPVWLKNTETNRLTIADGRFWNGTAYPAIYLRGKTLHQLQSQTSYFYALRESNKSCQSFRLNYKNRHLDHRDTAPLLIKIHKHFENIFKLN